MYYYFGGFIMAEFDDWYAETTILKGDECSKKLAAATAPTLRNNDNIMFVKSGMNHVAVIKPREDYVYFVTSVAGPADEKDMKTYVKKLIQKGLELSKVAGLTPIGFADVIDASRADPALAELIGAVLAEEATTNRLAVLNGEYADLGARVTVDANMNLTMISCAKKGINAAAAIGMLNSPFFNPKKDELIYVNSDGVGTKHEFYERLARLTGNYHALLGAVHDSLAMKLDDLVKINARVVAVSDTVEHNGFIHVNEANMFREYIGKEIGSKFGNIDLVFHDVGNNVASFEPSSIAYNMSGSSVSLINEQNLLNLPVPRAGNYLLAIVGQEDSPRSNGISLLRKIFENVYGSNWHKNPECKKLLEFASTPSDIFYPLFKELLDTNTANAVFHLSGGAYNGKLARPLAKEGLHVTLDNLWPVSDLIKDLIDKSGMPPSSFYNKWVMRNPGFVATDKPLEAMRIINDFGYAVKIAGHLEKSDKQGVSMTAYNGEKLYFDGR